MLNIDTVIKYKIHFSEFVNSAVHLRYMNTFRIYV